MFVNLSNLTRFLNFSRLKPLLLGNVIAHSAAPGRRTCSTKDESVLSLWNLHSCTLTLSKIEDRELSSEITETQLANPLIRKLLNGHNSAYAILQSLMKFSPQIDPLVSSNFYCRELEKLSIYGSDIEILFEVCGRDLIGFMSVLRARQLGLIEESSIYHLIETKEPINIQAIIRGVQKELYQLLDIGTLKQLCGNDLRLFKAALRARLAGVYRDDVYNAVQSRIFWNDRSATEEDQEETLNLLQLNYADSEKKDSE